MPSVASRLTSRQLTAWHLRHTQGLAVNQIAEELGITSCAVSHLLHRAQLHKGKPPRPHLKRRVVRPVSLSIYHLP